MKKETFLSVMFFALAMSASAQVEFLHTMFGRNVICRDKGLFWMDGDSDPCFIISNYKKAGGKETFNLTPKDPSDGKYAVTITLKDDKPTHIVMKGNETYSSDVTVETESEAPSDLVTYFRKEAGYTTPSAAGPRTGKASAGSAVEGKASAEGAVEGKDGGVGASVKGAFGKVKGLFKKKK